MKKVTKEHFSATVLKLDVTLTVTGSRLFTTEFKTRYGLVVGKTIERYGVTDDEDYKEDDFFTDL